IERDVFAPIALASPIQLPRGWSIAGFADPNSIDFQFSQSVSEGWYDGEAHGDNSDPGSDAENARFDGNWLLPETDYFEMLMQTPGAPPPEGYSPVVTDVDVNRTPRQTFMIRFQSGTGQLVRGSAPAIVIDPRPTSVGRGFFPQNLRWIRANRIEDARQWTERVVNADDLNGDGSVNHIDATFRVVAIGNFSNDTVLAGPVARLALYREEDLARGLGARGLNRETNSLYAPIAQEGRIAFDLEGLFSAPNFIDEPGEVRIAINRWMQGDTNFVEAGGFEDSDTDGDGNIFGDAAAGGFAPDTPMAKIFIVQPGTGELTGVSR
ncbi:MAG: hypothetical protein K8E66_10490, partial [Phycisphaerales bacterium]|nr:hypothetical protein [Phycisphaerales bacterium]